MPGRLRSLIARTVALACAISGSALAAYPPPVPDQLVLTVRETAGVARTGEVLRSGVPLPRALGILDTTDLAVVDGNDQAVPAQFRVLARWQAARDDAGAPIQWLLVTFPATVTAGGSATYRLVTDGSVPNPAPAQPLTLTQNGDQVTVDTGVARFVLGGGAGTLFDEIRLAGGAPLAGGGAITAAVAGTTWNHPTRRELRIEELGPLTAVVSLSGAYATPAIGGGGLGSERRYVFAAGSSTALVRQSIAWEGDLCGLGATSCGGLPNGVLLERVRDTLPLALGTPLQLTAVGAFASPAIGGSAALGQSAHLRQLQRLNRTAPLAFEVRVPGASTSTGSKADGGLLAASGPTGAIALAFDHLHRYEPQALRLLADGSLALDLADGMSWLSARQGTFASFAVAALGSAPSRAELDRQVWAPLNRPLRAWPAAAWFAASEAVEEFPVGSLPPNLTGYDNLLPAVLARTLTEVDDVGISGLMTYGLFPRNWGNPIYSDEVDCGDGDPTPANDWDDTFWCSTWTDYHSTAAAAPIWAMRSGEVGWLDEIAEPAALRMIHTQILQCAPGDTFFYCGQAPAGYGAYRSDSNGSHAYFENLFLYYWLTGDETVPRLLERGARTMRGFLCPSRSGEPPGPICAPDEPIVDPWASLNGRVAIQWYWVFRFLGTTLDASFLDDWSGNLARHLTLYHAEPLSAGIARALNVASGGGSLDYIDAAGTYGTNQLWMDALYDQNLLHRWQVDSQDQALGIPPLAPSAVGLAWARTLQDVSTMTPWSDGGPGGTWPNGLTFTFSGERIGGSLVSLLGPVDADGDGTPCELNDDDGDGDPNTYGDPCLYPSSKAALGASFLRAGDAAGDATLRALGTSFAEFGISTGLANLLPLSKETGILLSRLHAAVARAAATLIFADGFESGDTAAWSAATP